MKLAELLGGIAVLAILIGLLLPLVQYLNQNSQKPNAAGMQLASSNSRLAPYQSNVVLAPAWYKNRYKEWDGMDPTFLLSKINKLHCNILLLGLLVYPVLGGIALFRLVPNQGGETIVEKLFVLMPLAYFGTLLASFLVSGISYLLIGLVSDSESYVPWDFISFSFHAFLQCGLIIVSLTMLANWIAGRQVIPIPTHNPTPSRVRWVLASMLKAAIVTILTGIASTIGGWIGGGIIFVITTGIAAAFGINVAHAQEAE